VRERRNSFKALFSLFLVCVAAQGRSGWIAYNDSLRADHFPEIAFGAYLGTGAFLDGMFSNWQAAILGFGDPSDSGIGGSAKDDRAGMRQSGARQSGELKHNE
jgi:Domain of unknown function (DUF6766)